MVQSSGEVIALTAAFTFLALFFVGLRIWARQTGKLSLATDDVLILLAAFFFVLCCSIPIFVQCADANLGNHVQRTPTGDLIPPSYLFNVVEIIFESTHVIPITLTKCSILFFYKRIFRGPVFTATVWTSISLAVVWGLSFFFALLLMCTPLSTWVRYGSSAPGVSCTNKLQVYYSLSISDFLIDFIILIIPIPFVWHLQMPPRYKIAVTAIFLLGCLTIAASITRMVTFVKAANMDPEAQSDLTYYIAQTTYWTLIEASLAIVSACLPTLRPVFQGFSVESVVRSFRSVISLGSIRSRHSNGSKHSNIASVENRKESSSSTVGPHEKLAADHGMAVTANEIALHDMLDSSKIRTESIMVQRSFVMTDTAV